MKKLHYIAWEDDVPACFCVDVISSNNRGWYCIRHSDGSTSNVRRLLRYHDNMFDAWKTEVHRLIILNSGRLNGFYDQLDLLLEKMAEDFCEMGKIQQSLLDTRR